MSEMEVGCEDGEEQASALGDTRRPGFGRALTAADRRHIHTNAARLREEAKALHEASQELCRRAAAITLRVKG